ncbi:MAG TPA: ABC transporter permease [Candidatus Limnocylindrales bacterium]|nr:ABC transporter permease [Candidatus Limnocylindrales bacterium]
MNQLLQDLRYAIRMLAKSPGFTLIAVLTLALAIGANTALFSVVNGVLLNPLPYPEPNQLVTIHESKPNFATGSISYPNFLDWQRENHTLSAMAVSRPTSFSLTGLGDAEQLQAQFVTSDFFPILGIKPVMGRIFAPTDDQRGAAPVALISAGFWKRKFGSAPDVVGKTLNLNGRGYTIVGIIPSDFDLLLGAFNPSEVYVPVIQWGNDLLFNRGAGLGFHGIGRMKPGVTIDQTRADFAEVTRNLAAAYPDSDKLIGAAFFPFSQSVVGRVKPFLLMLFCAVGFVLLIACVNIANLLLARSAARSREFAVRAALGAGKSRIVRQLLTESVLLACVGAAIGLLLASWGTRAALQSLPVTLPRAAEVGMDPRVLLFTVAIALLAGVLFGLAPAMSVSRTKLQDNLKEGGRGASGSRHRLHAILVVAETALALVLLVGAGLMVRSLVRLWNVNPGFNPKNVLTFGLSLAPSMRNTSPAAIRATFRDVDSTLASVPGIEAVSMSWGAFPMQGDDEWLFWMQGQPKPTNQSDMKWTLEYVVDPDYIKVMQIPLRSGRFFTSQDNEHSPPVVLVDDIFVRQYFHNENPVGKRIFLDSLGGNPQAEIIGVVGHVKQWGLDTDDTEQLRAQLYFPFMQLPDSEMGGSGMRVVIRSRSAAPGLVDSIRHSLQQMNSEHVMYEAETMDAIISSSVQNRRFSMILLSIFAALALLLSSIGIYGVISYLVGQQTREIGIRIALGAQRRDVLRMVLGRGAKMAIAGVAIGVVAALGLTRLMGKMLYGITATDPVTFAAVAIILMLVALAACYIPARRAMSVNPLEALRYE